MTEIAGVLFDKDGTLLDFEATWGPSTAAVLTELSQGNAACFADLADMAGFLPETLGFTPDSPIIAGSTGDFAPGWAARIGVAHDAAFDDRVNRLYRETSLKSLTGYADNHPMLEALAERGIAVGLATNDSEANARGHLAALGIDGAFTFVAGYDSGYGAKPGSGMVLAFASHLGVAPSAVALVGDSLHDIDSARAAGALAIGIARTEAAARALGDHPDHLVRGMDDLLALLTERAGVRG